MALNLNVYKRIKDLNAKTTLGDADVLVSDNASENSSTKITFANLCTQLLTKLKLGAITSGHYIAGSTVAQDLTNLDGQVYTNVSAINNKVADVGYTNTGILQKTIGSTTSNVMLTDSAPTQNSLNPLQSGAAYDAFGDVADQISDLLGDFATVESSTTASQAYAVGDFLVLNQKLYKVTTAISSGGTITVGTNVTQTTVGAEVKNRTLWWASQAISSTSGSSGTLATITDARITADHVITKFVAANASYITSAITCTTSAGQAVITGISTAATTAEIVLEKKHN